MTIVMHMWSLCQPTWEISPAAFLISSWLWLSERNFRSKHRGRISSYFVKSLLNVLWKFLAKFLLIYPFILLRSCSLKLHNAGSWLMYISTFNIIVLVVLSAASYRLLPVRVWISNFLKPGHLLAIWAETNVTVMRTTFACQFILYTMETIR